MTQAEKISALFHDDGQRFYTDDGTSLHDVCSGAALRSLTTRDTTKYLFRDDSAITVAGGGWDLGYPECGCWQGAGHSASCKEVANA